MALCEHRLRANRAWVATHVPEPADGEVTWESMLAGPGTVGVLSSPDGARLIAIDLETATLIESLRNDAVLPQSLRRMPEKQRHWMLAKLVCDGVIEIEHEGVGFVSGGRASGIVFGDADPLRTDTLARLDPLARTALLHVVHRRLGPDLAIARRLYLANAAPRTAAWSRWVDRKGGVAGLLGLNSNEPWLRELVASHTAHGSATHGPWLGWVRKGVTRPEGFRHKIYVSPVPHRTAEALARVATVSMTMDVPALKVASTPESLLRPDKIVLHLESQAHLLAVATELNATLSGIEAQGVPFTAPLDNTGLLSWAVDPPETRGDERTGRQPRSWRIWIAFVLARALGAVHNGWGTDEQIGFALDRLRLEGVEPIGWRWSVDR